MTDFSTPSMRRQKIFLGGALLLAAAPVMWAQLRWRKMLVGGTLLVAIAPLSLELPSFHFFQSPAPIVQAAAPIEKVTSEKRVALTFDDGPNGEATRTIVDILVDEKVPAMFFEVGRSVIADPDTAKYVSDHGFIIGNHSWDHSWNIPNMTEAEVSNELITTNNIIQSITGNVPVYVRWPHGKHSPVADQVTENLRLHQVFWKVDPADYATNDPDLLVRRTIENVRDGSIIVLHDGLQDGKFSKLYHQRQATIDALPKIIYGLRGAGYTFVDVPELIGLNRSLEY